MRLLPLAFPNQKNSKSQGRYEEPLVCFLARSSCRWSGRRYRSLVVLTSWFQRCILSRLQSRRGRAWLQPVRYIRSNTKIASIFETQAQLKTNVSGQRNLIRVVLPHMRAHRPGIIALQSGWQLRKSPGCWHVLCNQSHHNMTFLIMMTRSRPFGNQSHNYRACPFKEKKI